MDQNNETTKEAQESQVITAPDAVIVPLPPKEKEVAYVITDKYFEEGFEVVKSLNAWWMDRGKVTNLIAGFKNGYNIKQSCIYAGISIDQYKYFLEIHPGFSTVKEICEELSKMLIEAGLTQQVQKANPAVLMWAAERRIPEKYGKHLAEGGGGNIIQNFGTIVNVKPETAERILQHRKAQNGNQ